MISKLKMPPLVRAGAVIALLCVGGVSCQFMTANDYDVAKPALLIRGVLKPGVAVDSVVIRRTISMDKYWDGRDDDLVRVSGASVTLKNLDDNTVFPLSERIQPGQQGLIQTGQVGVYSNPSMFPESGKTYRLDVEAVIEGQTLTVWAQTTLPDPIRVTSGGVDTTIVYPGQYAVSFEDIPLRLEWENLGATPAGYVLGIQADTSAPEGRWLKSYDEYDYAELYTDHMDTATGELKDQVDWPWSRIEYERDNFRNDRRLALMPIIGDSTGMDLFWFFFRFEGDYDVVINALDEDLWDFYRTVGQGNSGNDSDVGAIYNVQGDGIGILGSWYTVRFPIHVVNAAPRLAPTDLRGLKRVGARKTN